MPRVFLSYRRGDSAAYTGRLSDALIARFGEANVFMDIDTISPGSDFADVIQSALEDCDALVAVIGPVWASVTDAAGQRRLFAPDDFVRLEVATALERNIRVLPVLVGGATMPSGSELPESLAGLARLHAIELSNPRWRYDVGKLVEALDRDGSSPGKTGAAAETAAPTGLATLLFTALEGSPWGLKADDPELVSVLSRGQELVRGAIVAAGGFVIERGGAFRDAHGAAAAAAAIGRSLAAESWPEATPVRMAIALHSGHVQLDDGEYVGAVVDRAARLVAVAHGGQVVASVWTADLIGDALPPGISLQDLGEHRLRDLGRPERVFQVCADGLATNFPSLRSLDNPTQLHNLPEQVSSFVGRDVEVAEIAALLRKGRLVTLSGPGGVGKTRLALQAAAEVQDGTGDGVWFVDLAAITDPSLVAASVAGVLGVRQQPGRSLLESLVEGLGDRKLMDVLDNCEHVIAPAATLAETLLRRCPRIVMLTTSREPLGIGGEHVYRVPSLSLPGPDDVDPVTLATFESVRLFVERAAQQKPGFALDDDNAATIGRLCRRLDGIPFAIELAAARLRSMSARDLEARLDKRFKILTGGSRTALPRQQTLQALIDFSYDLLSSPEQTLLARLSVFSGGFDLPAAETVCPGGEVDDFEILDFLDALVDKSLIQADHLAGAVRFRLLESIREYAAAKLALHDEVDRDGLSRAHRDYFLALAEEAAPHLRGADDVEWANRLDVEVDNLRLALVECLGDPDAAPGLRLGVALSDFWFLRGRGVEGAEALRTQLDRAEAVQAMAALRGQALAARARLVEYYLGDYPTAEALAGEALAIARAGGDGKGGDALAAHALLVLAWAKYRQGDPDGCLSILDEALPIARRVDDPRAAAHLLNLQAHRLSARGEDPQASFEEAASLYRRAGDRYGVAVVLTNMGGSALVAGDYAAARGALDEATSVFRDLGHSTNLAICACNEGTIAHLEGDDVAADQLFHETLATSRRIGSRPLVAYALLGLAMTAGRLGDARRGATLHGAFDARQSPVEALEQGLRDESRAVLRSQLGDDLFDAAYQAGLSLSFDEALSLASRAPVPSPAPAD